MPTRYYGVQNEVKAYCNRLQNETSIVVTPSVLKTLNDRVESLKRSGVWSRFGLGFNDNDGDAYLSRASVTNVIGRAEVLWFTRGIKSLGLWNNIVSWSLRSYQNAGSGSTVYSLGGLGTFDGTMINSPSWGSNGINFVNANTQYISTTYNTVLNNFSFITALIIPNTGLTRYIAGQTIQATGRAWDFNIQTSGNTFTQFSIESTRSSPTHLFNVTITTNTPTFITTTRSPTQLTQIHNGIQTTNAAAAYSNLNPSQFLIGASDFGTRNNAFEGTMHIANYFNIDLSYSQQEMFRGLYKQTVGNGLGLP